MTIVNLDCKFAPTQALDQLAMSIKSTCYCVLIGVVKLITIGVVAFWLFLLRYQ